jgi:hypothetical protein
LYLNDTHHAQGDVYLDGNFCYTGYANYQKSTGTYYAPRINGCDILTTWNKTINGYISSLRVYNRVLEEIEVQALAAEFNPTT